MTRREFGASLVAVAYGATKLGAREPRATPIAVRSLNHIAFRVSDLQRTIDWYQRIFGLPVHHTVDAAGGRMAVLPIGGGPQFIALFAANGAAPGHSHMGLGVPGFDRARVEKLLAAHNVKVEARNRKADGGEVQELIFMDADNLPVQLQDVSYRGGGGILGNAFPRPSAPAAKGSAPPIVAKTLNHVSFQVADIDRAVRFYMRVFDMWIQTVQPMTAQAPVPILGIGDGPELIAPYGGNGAKPGIGHCCLGIEKFDYARIEAALAAHGIKATGRVRPSSPPYDVREGYMLRDPDNISVQIADAAYCGGRGEQGHLCP
jgi:catechol 2,3-dioxygenase-like lactoylglutathione lyase family enzyme